MSDTSTCPNCSASLPEGAAFCTTCGHKVEATSAPAADAPVADAPTAGRPPADATRIDDQGFQDPTRVLPTQAPASEPAGGGWSAPAAQPAPPPAPAAPAAPSWGAAPAAPQAPPAPQSPPAWNAPPQQGSPAPGGWQQAPPQSAPQFGAPQPQWGGGAPATTSSGGGSPLGALVGIVGGVLVLIGIFTAWLKVKGATKSITGWDLATDKTIRSTIKSSDPYILLAIGIVAIVVGVVILVSKGPALMRIVLAILGVATIGVLLKDYLDIKDLVKKLPVGVTVNFQIGFWLGIIGGVVLIVAAVLPSGSKRT